MKEVENKQAFYNNGIYFNLSLIHIWCLSKQDKGYDRYPVYVNAIDGTIIRSDDLI